MFALIALVLLLASPWLGHATTYTFEEVAPAFAGVTSTAPTGLQGSTEVGTYNDGIGIPHGYIRKHSQAAILPYHTPHGVCAEGIVGTRQLDSGSHEGFFLQDGTLRRLFVLTRPDPDGPRLVHPTEALSCGGGWVVGTWTSLTDGEVHGFAWEIATRTMHLLDVPDARSTSLHWITPQGEVLGSSTTQEGVSRQFRLNDISLRNFVFLTLLEPAISLVAFHGNQYVGNLGQRGVVLEGDHVQFLDVPGGTLTQIFGSTAQGKIFGRFIDASGVHKGFIATPDPTTRRRR